MCVFDRMREIETDGERERERERDNPVGPSFHLSSKIGQIFLTSYPEVAPKRLSPTAIRSKNGDPA